MEARLKQLLADRLGVEDKLKESKEVLLTLEAEIRTFENQRNETTERAARVRESLEDERVQRQGMAVQESNLLEQLATTGHELESVQQKLPEDASEASWVEEIERMVRRIQRLGAINLAAIEELMLNQSARPILTLKRRTLNRRWKRFLR